MSAPRFEVASDSLKGTRSSAVVGGPQPDAAEVPALVFGGVVEAGYASELREATTRLLVLTFHVDRFDADE